eukprot:21744-Hanusia_phi.AAC.1
MTDRTHCYSCESAWRRCCTAERRRGTGRLLECAKPGDGDRRGANGLWRGRAATHICCSAPLARSRRPSMTFSGEQVRKGQTGLSAPELLSPRSRQKAETAAPAPCPSPARASPHRPSSRPSLPLSGAPSPAPRIARAAQTQKPLAARPA